ncbi:type II secretion system F family protein (plasmid) [Marinovum sp. KMM 9989]
MAAFSYTAFDGKGAKVRGVLVADGLGHARTLLGKQGLFPETLTETSEKQAGGRLKSLRSTALSQENLAVFSRQLAVLLAAQIPLDEALRVLMGSEVGGPVNRVAALLQTHIRDGLSLPAAMNRLPGAFPDYYRAAIAAGESSGELERVCDVLAEFIETRMALRDTTVNSLVYPLFVGAVSLVVAGILLMNVVPELALLFEQTGQPLPPITQASIAIGNFLADNWPYLAGGILALVSGLRLLLKRPGPRRFYHRTLLRLPVLGPLARLKAAVLFLRTFSLVLAANVPAVSALRHAAAAIDNVVLRDEAAGSYELVEQGQRIAAAMKTVSALPVIALQMLESGERSGRLVEMTTRAAGLAERSLAFRSKRVATLLEPLMMMTVGGLVLVIVLSVLLPIFDLQTTFVN